MGTGGTSTGGATGGHTGGTTGTGGAATGGVTGGATGGISGTGGSASVSGTGGTAPPSNPPASGGGTAGSGTCGNGKLDPGEACDGTAMQSATCAQLGFSGGALACSSTCQFDASGCTGGTLTPTVSATSTSCTAPCGVFFDATGTSGLSGSDYVAANWTWDFRDPTSPHPAAVGFVAGHVFDNPGTYVVTARLRDMAGAAGWATKTVTVGASPFTTYYVSAAGSDSNSGTSTTTAFKTLAHALPLLGANVAVLLRRGDTFSGPSSLTTVTGPSLLGAYTDPSAPSSAAPIWNSAVAPNAYNYVFTLTGASPRITDIHLVANNVFDAFGFSAATNAIVERVEVSGIGFNDSGSTAGQNFYVSADSVGSFVFDNNLHDFNGYGLFGATVNKLSITGNTLANFGGQDHGMRIAGGDRTAITQNTIAASDTNSPFSGITIRGNDTNIVVAQNTSNRLIEFTPQNTTSVELVQDALCDGNTVNDNRVTDYYSIGIGVTAKHVIVRNNVIVGSPTAVSVFGQPQLPANWVDKIAVYNNTSRFAPASYNANYGAFFASQSATTGSVSVRDNIFTLTIPATGAAVLFLGADGKGTHSEDHNLGYDQNWASLSPSSGGAGDLVGNPQFVATSGASAFKLASNSAARNAGTPAPAYQDCASVIRPATTADDIGAYEYTP